MCDFLTAEWCASGARFAAIQKFGISFCRFVPSEQCWVQRRRQQKKYHFKISRMREMNVYQVELASPFITTIYECVLGNESVSARISRSLIKFN